MYRAHPDKPIYDIPGVANQTGKEHIEALLEQIKPFDYNVHLNTRVEKIEPKEENGLLKQQWFRVLNSQYFHSRWSRFF